jgi:hypothetical protein
VNYIPVANEKRKPRPSLPQSTDGRAGSRNQAFFSQMGRHGQEIQSNGARSWAMDHFRKDSSEFRQNVPRFPSKKIEVDSNCYNRGNARKKKKNMAFVSDQFRREMWPGRNYLRGKMIENET